MMEEVVKEVTNDDIIFQYGYSGGDDTDWEEVSKLLNPKMSPHEAKERFKELTSQTKDFWSNEDVRKLKEIMKEKNNKYRMELARELLPNKTWKSCMSKAVRLQKDLSK